jgi:regulator of cell morphogenesis and NO signaling
VDIRGEMNVTDIAALFPATISVFQQRGIPFCCSGRLALTDACARAGISADTLLVELRALDAPPGAAVDWNHASLADLVAHLRTRRHAPLRAELTRLDGMLAKAVERHGQRLPGLAAVREAFQQLAGHMVLHMRKGEDVLFPAMLAALAPDASGGEVVSPRVWVHSAIAVMQAENDDAVAALGRIATLTSGFDPPANACPTIRGLFFGLAHVADEIQYHVRLDCELFSRAAPVHLLDATGDVPTR